MRTMGRLEYVVLSDKSKVRLVPRASKAFPERKPSAWSRQSFRVVTVPWVALAGVGMFGCKWRF